MEVTSAERARKQHRVESLREKAKMLTAFEDLWVSGQLFLSGPGPSSATQLLLVTPVAVPAPVPTVVPIAVSVTSSACSDLSHSAASSSCSGELSQSRHSPGSCPVPVRSWPRLPVVPGSATRLIPGPVPCLRHLPARLLLPILGPPVRHPIRNG